MSVLHADPDQRETTGGRRRADLDGDVVAVAAMLMILALTAVALLVMSLPGL